jgi:hypothetical protein
MVECAEMLLDDTDNNGRFRHVGTISLIERLQRNGSKIPAEILDVL